MTGTEPNVVAAVVAHHLCCGCGTCVAVCPTAALGMTETPAGFLVAEEVNAAACTHCGRCRRACPGAPLTEASERIFEALDDPFIGSIRAAYWGWAEAPETRRRGASGGVVTALVAHLLRTGSVQAALVTRWSPDDPLRHEAFIARGPEELDRSQKSRYCSVALNAALPALLEFERVAIVGLPCHLRGLEQALPLLGRRFPETVGIGLFCEATLSRLLIDDLLARARSRGPVNRFEYRDKGLRGWPGDVHVLSEGGSTFLDRDERIVRKYAYTPARCRLCPDKFNVFADIACGDGYGAPHEDEGVSAILVRTARGEALLAEARGELHLEAVAANDLLRGQYHEQRRRDCRAHAAAFQGLFPEAPPALPRSCLRSAEVANRQAVKGAERHILDSVRLATAADRAQARRRARGVRWRQRVRAGLRQARSLLGRSLRRLLGPAGVTAAARRSR